MSELAQEPERLSIDEAAKRLFEIRNQIAEIKRLGLKPLEEERDELEEVLMAHLGELNVDSIAIKGVGTVGVNESVVPQAEDWDKFYAYLLETGNFFLLNRALNAASYREAVQIGEDIPGLKPFTKRKLSVRKAA